MPTIEYITADGHLIDPVDGVKVRTNWDRQSVGEATAHFSPLFDKLRPLGVFVGFSRRNVDMMEMIVFWGRENLSKNKKVWEAEEKWTDERDRRNQMIDAHNFSLSRTGVLHRGQPVDWEQALISCSATPARYRQIWPPQPISVA